MNPEEFDKRLSESFKNEHLPPDKRLWQDISSRLDQGKKPVWYWLLPVVVVLTIAAGWLFNIARPHEAPTELSANETHQENNTVKAGEITPTVVLPSAQPNAATPAPDATGNGSANSAPASDRNSTAQNTTNASRASGSTSTVEPSQRPSGSRPVNNNGLRNNGIHLATYFTPAPVQASGNETDIAMLRMNSLIHPFIPRYELEKEEMINYDFPFKNKRTYRSPYTKNPVNFDSKWFWSFGIGPQFAFNKAVVPADSQAWVHKELWENRGKMTSNGRGFQTQFLLGHALGKHFSIESGLQYSQHTEDIKFNFSSTFIETRSGNNNMITAYQDSVFLWFIQKGHTDTTWYLATRAFSLAVKNRYNIFTVPVKFNFEYDLSDRTKFVAGIGAGLTAITVRKVSHLNITEDSKEVIDKATHQFTASLNAQFGFYTNFNDIGQLGIYSGFQMYTKPWQLSNKQYAISMSDLQLGISFRRPLNW